MDQSLLNSVTEISAESIGPSGKRVSGIERLLPLMTARSTFHGIKTRYYSISFSRTLKQLLNRRVIESLIARYGFVGYLTHIRVYAAFHMRVSFDRFYRTVLGKL